jgi:PAS domain S-box-containing protein
VGKESTPKPSLHPQLQTFLLLSEDCIIVLDANYCILEFNEASKSLLGWKDKEMLGQPFASIYFELGSKIPFPFFQYELILQQDAGEFECMLYKNNTKRYLTWKFKRQSNQIILLGKDKTDTKRLALQHVTIFDQIKKISACVPGNFYWKNKDEEYLGCNKILLKTLGLNSMNDFVGKTDLDLWPEHAAELRKNDQQVIKGKKPVFFEETVTLNGKKMYFTVIKMPLIDDEGNIIGILGNSSDITELKRTQAALKIAKETAEKASQAKTEFLANMSHDIRTPLTGIIGMTKMLEETARSEEERQYASWVNESGEQLLKLLNGVLDVVSADDMNEDDLYLESFHLRDCLEDLNQLERPAMMQKDISFQLKIAPNIPEFIRTDRFKLSRVLLNLLGNAIKFTDQGMIQLIVDLINSDDQQKLLMFKVVDTGKGIPKEAQKKVFERFYRISPSYKNNHHGHGVGLHIVEKYVELLGGKIGINSEEGKGTTFYFAIPLVPAVAPEIDEKENLVSSPPVQTPLYSPYLLLVEDSIVALKVLERMVMKAGCRYLSATSGEKGLLLAKTEPFDLIITDIGLPGISGNEMTRQIRDWEKQKGSTSPFLIYGLTGHAGQIAEAESLNLGMNGVFTKPMTAISLRTLLDSFQPRKNEAAKASLALGLDLPNTEEELFALNSFPVLDIDKGIAALGSLSLFGDLLLTLSSEDLPHGELGIRQAYIQADWPKIESLTHKLKSGAVYCCTTKLQYACQYLERYSKAGHSRLLEKLYYQLIQVIGETRHAVNRWLEEHLLCKEIES